MSDGRKGNEWIGICSYNYNSRGGRHRGEGDQAELGERKEGEGEGRIKKRGGSQRECALK